MVADPAHDGGERVVLHDLPPGRFVAALLGLVEPPLDVLPGRARGVARRPGPRRPALGAPAAGVVGQARPDAEGDREGPVSHHSLLRSQSVPAMLRSAMAWSRSMTSARRGRRTGGGSASAGAGTPATGRRPRIGDTRPLRRLGLEDGEQAGLAGKARQPDRLARRAPAQWARHQHVQVAGAAERHRAATLASRSRRSATVAVATYGIPCAIAMRGRSLPWPNALPGASRRPASSRCARPAVWRRSAARRCSCRPGCRSRRTARRRRARTCPTGRPKPMSTVPPSPACATTRMSSGPGPQRRGHAGRDRRRVAEQRVQPRRPARTSPGTAWRTPPGTRWR